MQKICRFVHNKEKEKQRAEDFKEINKDIDVINIKDLYFHKGFKNINSNNSIKNYNTVRITYDKTTKEWANGLFYFFDLYNKKILNFSGFKKTGKLIESIFFNKYQIRHPETICFFITKEYIDKYIKILEQTIDYPIVTKEINSSKGKGVSLIKNRIDCIKYFEDKENAPIIFQEYINNTGDYRIFVIGEETPLAFKRFNKEDFRSNLYLGGGYEVVEINSNVQKKCIEINKQFGCDFSGIDFFLNEEDNLIVIEINQMPGYKLKVKEETGFNLLEYIFK